MNDKKHIMLFSGGLGSYFATKRLLGEVPKENIVLLFTDTLMEDEDLYRFLKESVDFLGLKLITLSQGMDPWGIFYKQRFLGNSRVDPCSKFLKRVPARKWIKENYEPGDCTIYLGIDWTEINRLTKISQRWKPYEMKAPLCEAPYLSKVDMIREIKEDGIDPPRLYGLGFAHNNCGGFCVKAGQAQFANLFKKMPERYAYHEKEEEKFRTWIGKDVTILKNQVTLKDFRIKLEKNDRNYDLFDWGGCGCMSD